MKKRLPALITLTLLCVYTCGLSQDGNKQVIQDEMTGHIFRPAQVDATKARLSQLKMSEGFAISVFADSLYKPRMLEVTPEGFIYATDRDAGVVVLLMDADNNGKAEMKKVVAKKDQLHGIDYHAGKLYLTTVTEIYTASINADGTLGDPKLIISNLPDGGQHPNRTLHFGPDDKLYISVGSTCNSCDEPNEQNATLLQANADGSGLKIYAKVLWLENLVQQRSSND